MTRLQLLMQLCVEYLSFTKGKHFLSIFHSHLILTTAQHYLNFNLQNSFFSVLVCSPFLKFAEAKTPYMESHTILMQSIIWNFVF